MSAQAVNELMVCTDFSFLLQKEVAFKDLCCHILDIVVGQSQMATMGKRYGNSRKKLKRR